MSFEPSIMGSLSEQDVLDQLLQRVEEVLKTMAKAKDAQSRKRLKRGVSHLRKMTKAYELEGSSQDRDEEIISSLTGSQDCPNKQSAQRGGSAAEPAVLVDGQSRCAVDEVSLHDVSQTPTAQRTDDEPSLFIQSAQGPPEPLKPNTTSPLKSPIHPEGIQDPPSSPTSTQMPNVFPEYDGVDENLDDDFSPEAIEANDDDQIDKEELIAESRLRKKSQHLQQDSQKKEGKPSLKRKKDSTGYSVESEAKDLLKGSPLNLGWDSPTAHLEIQDQFYETIQGHLQETSTDTAKLHEAEDQDLVHDEDPSEPQTSQKSDNGETPSQKESLPRLGTFYKNVMQKFHRGTLCDRRLFPNHCKHAVAATTDSDLSEIATLRQQLQRYRSKEKRDEQVDGVAHSLLKLTQQLLIQKNQFKISSKFVIIEHYLDFYEGFERLSRLSRQRKNSAQKVLSSFQLEYEAFWKQSREKGKDKKSTIATFFIQHLRLAPVDAPKEIEKVRRRLLRYSREGRAMHVVLTELSLKKENIRKSGAMFFLDNKKALSVASDEQEEMLRQYLRLVSNRSKLVDICRKLDPIAAQMSDGDQFAPRLPLDILETMETIRDQIMAPLDDGSEGTRLIRKTRQSHPKTETGRYNGNERHSVTQGSVNPEEIQSSSEDAGIESEKVHSVSSGGGLASSAALQDIMDRQSSSRVSESDKIHITAESRTKSIASKNPGASAYTDDVYLSDAESISSSRQTKRSKISLPRITTSPIPVSGMSSSGRKQKSHSKCLTAEGDNTVMEHPNILIDSTNEAITASSPNPIPDGHISDDCILNDHHSGLGNSLLNKKKQSRPTHPASNLLLSSHSSSPRFSSPVEPSSKSQSSSTKQNTPKGRVKTSHTTKSMLTPSMKHINQALNIGSSRKGLSCGVIAGLQL